MCRPAEEVRKDVLLPWPMPDIQIVLVQLRTARIRPNASFSTVE